MNNHYLNVKSYGNLDISLWSIETFSLPSIQTWCGIYFRYDTKRINCNHGSLEYE